MDVSEKPGNSRELIENFVNENCAGLKEYHNSVLASLTTPCVFPPGHKLRIRNFVAEAKKKFGQNEGQEETKKSLMRRKKRKTVHHSIVKRPVKVNEYSKTETGSVESNFDSVSSVSQQVRTSIAAWVRKQPNEKLRKLKENKHFTICITNLVRSNLVSVRVKCNPCKTYIQLYRKDKSVVGSSYLISNWTSHVKMYSQLNKPSESVQMSMLGFLSAGSFSTSTSQFSSGSLPCTETTSSTTSSNLSDAVNESSHDDLPPTNK